MENFLHILTLIVLGKVKVNDIKFQTKFLCTEFLKILPIPAETSFKSFQTYDMMSKNVFLTSKLPFFQKSGRSTTLPILPFRAVFLPYFSAIQSTLGRQMSWWAPVNIPVSFRTRAVQSGGGWLVLSRVCPLTLFK
jgi:hypothetical protein